MNTPTAKERMLGALWGAAAGDALGVPVEFKDRAELLKKPVTDMRGYGTHHQPPGTWSDDTSLTLCTIESLLKGFDPEDMGQRFVAWSRQDLWTAHGEVFDIGNATSEALAHIEAGVAAEKAGGKGVDSNGNGSLMRILPIALRYWAEPRDVLLDYASRASAITHGHPRSRIACGFFCLFAAEILRGRGPEEAYSVALGGFNEAYSIPPLKDSLLHFPLITAGNLAEQPVELIPSSGYVVHTLTASLWCLLTTTSFEEAVLRAVNLGSDTDTTGTVTGGLAGLYYGVDAVPRKWRESLARQEDLQRLYAEFLRGQRL